MDGGSNAAFGLAPQNGSKNVGGTGQNGKIAQVTEVLVEDESGANACHLYTSMSSLDNYAWEVHSRVQKWYE